MNPEFIGPTDLPAEFTAARSESWHHFMSRMRRRHAANPVRDDLYPPKPHVWPKGKPHWCGTRPGKKWMDYAEFQRRREAAQRFKSQSQQSPSRGVYKPLSGPLPVTGCTVAAAMGGNS
jgi:hypothetical protein